MAGGCQSLGSWQVSSYAEKKLPGLKTLGAPCLSPNRPWGLTQSPTPSAVVLSLPSPPARATLTARRVIPWPSGEVSRRLACPSSVQRGQSAPSPGEGIPTPGKDERRGSAQGKDSEDEGTESRGAAVPGRAGLA